MTDGHVDPDGETVKLMPGCRQRHGWSTAFRETAPCVANVGRAASNRWATWLAAVATILLCAPQGTLAQQTEPSRETRLPVRNAAPREIGLPATDQERDATLLYWSNRRLADSRQGALRLPPTLGAGHGGAVRISIPSEHRRCHCERPWLFQREDRRRHIAVQQITPLSDEQFFETLADRVAKAASRDVLVLVHGYKNTFEITAWRAGQLAVDLDFSGTIVVFSWPSQGSPLPDDYFADDLSVMTSVPHLVDLLRHVRKTVPQSRLHVLAHSMGCRLSCAALAYLATSAEPMPVLNQLILTAPDIDGEAFVTVFARPLTTTARRVSLYVNAQDQVLAASRTLHANRSRLGDASQRVVSLPGIQTIDVTGVINEGETLPTGHRYYCTSATVMDDFAGVFRGESPTARGLQPQPGDSDQPRHWSFPPRSASR